MKLDDDFFVETEVKISGDKTEHYCIKLVQGIRSIEIYADVLNELVEIHSKIEEDYEKLVALKTKIYKKISDLFLLLKAADPKTVSECQKIFINSTLYECDNPIDVKIINQGMWMFFRNFQNFEKENIASLAAAAAVPTSSKRKR